MRDGVDARPSRLDPAVRRGPGRVLVAVYAIFALAASARSAVQIGTRLGEAPLAYGLSAFAALVYVIATVTLAIGARRVALVACAVELVGVLTVGTLSLADAAAFPDATVWSGYGAGYGFVPLILPPLGLLWLRHTAKAATAPSPPSG